MNALVYFNVACLFVSYQDNTVIGKAVEGGISQAEALFLSDNLFGNARRVMNNKDVNAVSDEPEEIEGDILVSDYVRKLIAESKEINQKRYVLTREESKWRDNKYYYQISQDLSSGQQKEIRSALDYMSKVSCIQFIEGTDKDGYVLFRKSPHTHCNSFVGRTGATPQVINVPDWCKKPTLIHEIMHSLGFFHEHNRKDRDNFVTIHEENIIEDDKNQFIKYVHPAASSLKKPYDYDSIMHYGKYAFSKNGKVTIQPKKHVVIGGQERLSTLDKDTLLRFYNCVPCKDEKWHCPFTHIFGKCNHSSKCRGSCRLYCKA